MEMETLKLAAGQGLYALLFVTLLFYVLKENSKRELKYQEIIVKVSDQIHDDIKEIKAKIIN